MPLTLTIILAAAVLLTISLQKTYSAVPVKELKRRARNHDEVARVLYDAVSYSHSLRAVLWTLICVTSAGFFVALTLIAPVIVALAISIMVVWLSFIWLPNSRVTAIGQRIALWCAPPLAWVLQFIHPPIDQTYQFIRQHRPINVHTGLYQKSDLVDLINRQQVQTDNRIDKAELDVAKHALTFGDLNVRDRLTPKRVVSMVKIDEPIGPVLMTELHESGHSRFPVYDGKKNNIVGMLYMRDLIKAKHTGTVRSIMHQEVCYIH